MNRTVKLLLDTGLVIDRKRSDRPRMVKTPEFINNVRSRIYKNPVPKQKDNGSENEYYTENHVVHVQAILGTQGFQSTNRKTPNCCVKKYGKGNKNAWYNTLKSIIVFTDEKK